ncbi:MAG: hypothetical protein JJE40_04660 [Vicinamibacteria bacterium]|nr:hypothetical protein [Vicinamibacteria bacterium]
MLRTWPRGASHLASGASHLASGASHLASGAHAPGLGSSRT